MVDKGMHELRSPLHDADDTPPPRSPGAWRPAVMAEKLVVNLARLVMVVLLCGKYSHTHPSSQFGPTLSWLPNASWWLAFFLPSLAVDVVGVIGFRRCLSQYRPSPPAIGLPHALYHWLTFQFAWFADPALVTASMESACYAVYAALAVPFGVVFKVLLCLRLEHNTHLPALAILSPLVVSLALAFVVLTFASPHNRAFFGTFYPVLGLASLACVGSHLDGAWTRGWAGALVPALVALAALVVFLDACVILQLPNNLPRNASLFTPELVWLHVLVGGVFVATLHLLGDGRVPHSVFIVGPCVAEGAALLQSVWLLVKLVAFAVTGEQEGAVLVAHEVAVPEPPSTRAKQQLQYWKTQLADAPPLLEVICDQPRVNKAADTKVHEAVRFQVDAGVTTALREAAWKEKAELFTLLLAAWKLLLARYGRQEDLVCACPVSNSRQAQRNEVGVRSLFEDRHMTFSSYVRALHLTLKHALDNADARLADVISELGVVGEGGITPLVQCQFAMDSKALISERGWRFSRDGVTFKYDLELHVEELSDGTLSFALAFDTALFNITAERMSLHLPSLLQSLAQGGMARQWHALPLMDSNERDQVLYGLNNTAQPYPDTLCIHHLFVDIARANPDHVALLYHIHEDPLQPLGEMTYGQVLDQALALAKQLRALGVQEDTMVPIMMDRSYEVVIAIYGILCAGGCYVPIEPKFPADRIEHILQDTGATVVLTQRALRDRLDGLYKGALLCVEDVQPGSGKDFEVLPQSPDSLVYVFYTSGTTGKPKGCMISHRGLVKRSHWLQATYPMRPHDRMIQKTPYSFGVSEWEFFWALPFGGQLVISSTEGHKDPEYLLNLSRTHGITHMCMVPSMLTIWMEFMQAEGANNTTAVRAVLCAGEALPVDTCKQFRKAFAPTTHLINLYGPTEADMTVWEAPVDCEHLTRVPIGLPVHNVKIYILDENRQPVPRGVPGELYFGGVSTARGYVKLPEATAKAFVHCEWHDPVRDTPLMYRTGDLARWAPDGQLLEFLGRVDHQVKLRGFRIELGEIESVLGQCEGVVRVAVILHGTSPANHQIVAYVTPESLNPAVLVRALKRKLPEYMIPSVIAPLKDLPVTARGKLDRQALPDPSTFKAALQDAPDEFVPPRTTTEHIVASVWEDVLRNGAKISVVTQFTSLGGNSLLAGRATSQIRKRTGIRIPGTAMYTHATVEKIADLVDKLSKKQGRAVGGEGEGEGEGEGGASQPPGPNLNDNSSRRAWGGRSSTSWQVICTQVLGLMFTMLLGPCSLIPGWYYCYDVYWLHGKLVTCLTIPVVLLVTLACQLTLTTLVKYAVFPRAVPGSYPLWGNVYLRWWMVQNVCRTMNKTMNMFFGDTALYNLWFRLLGADIGERVSISTSLVGEPSLLTIGHDTTVGMGVVICPHSIENGYLVFRPIVIGHHCRIGARSYVTQGTHLEPGTRVGGMSSTRLGATDLSKVGEDAMNKPVYTQNLLRICVGTPLLIFATSLAYFPAIYLLDWFYYAFISPNFHQYLYLYLLTSATLPWLYALFLPEMFFWVVMAFKWVFIGRFRPGPRPRTAYFEFCRWALDNLVHNELFEQAMRPWINTEVLACKYRLLGAWYGSRTHSDFVQLVEFDLLTVGRDTVFGSNVTILPIDEEELLPVVLEPGSQVLDHCLLLPGVRVCRGALCGSSTLGAKNYTFPPNTISTGNKGGKCVQLRVRGNDHDGFAHLPDDERRLVQRAHANHRSLALWLVFNLYNVVAVLVLGPLPQVVEMVSVILYIYFTDWEVFSAGVLGYAMNLLVAVPIYLLLYVAEALVIVALKYAIMGRYREGNHPFYSKYHFKWISMMLLRNAVRALEEDLNGTPFAAMLLRLLGGHIGKDVCMFGFGLEYDLLFVGDRSSVGDRCDATCHTVENMVIKLAPVRIGTACSRLAGSVVMPGGVMEDNSTVLENSVVLKGETVLHNEVWAGLPAELVERPLAREEVAARANHHRAGDGKASASHVRPKATRKPDTRYHKI